MFKSAVLSLVLLSALLAGAHCQSAEEDLSVGREAISRPITAKLETSAATTSRPFNNNKLSSEDGESAATARQLSSFEHRLKELNEIADGQQSGDSSNESVETSSSSENVSVGDEKPQSRNLQYVVPIRPNVAPARKGAPPLSGRNRPQFRYKSAPIPPVRYPVGPAKLVHYKQSISAPTGYLRSQPPQTKLPADGKSPEVGMQYKLTPGHLVSWSRNKGYSQVTPPAGKAVLYRPVPLIREVYATSNPSANQYQKGQYLAYERAPQYYVSKQSLEQLEDYSDDGDDTADASVNLPGEELLTYDAVKDKINSKDVEPAVELSKENSNGFKQEEGEEKKEDGKLESEAEDFKATGEGERDSGVDNGAETVSPPVQVNGKLSTPTEASSVSESVNDGDDQDKQRDSDDHDSSRQSDGAQSSSLNTEVSPQGSLNGRSGSEAKESSENGGTSLRLSTNDNNKIGFSLGSS